MCDTIGKIINNNYAIFGKNSDRGVNEPQVVEFHPAKDYTKAKILKCTYISIPQVKHTNAIVLSRPTWLWGGEIGVNEYGVCIGNEALFTKGKYGEKSLIGMDLLRLGLERGNTAKEALDVIVELLQEYGQGGNCGYDSEFFYDNSFLIMDKNEIYVLETVGKDYAYKRHIHTSISNIISITDDGDFYKKEKINFKEKYLAKKLTDKLGGEYRRACSITAKLKNAEDMFAILRGHQNKKVFSEGSVSSVCMHAATSEKPNQTTMSMVVELKDDDIIIWLTGSSLPCNSLFKPYKFDELCETSIDYWYKHEIYNRKFIGAIIPKEYNNELKETQKKILENRENALEIEDEFYEKWDAYEFEYDEISFESKEFWDSKNKTLEKEMNKRCKKKEEKQEEAE